MKIGCLMVTEGRPHVAGIALASYIDQTHCDKELLVISNEGYQDAISRNDETSSIIHRVSLLTGKRTACQRLDEGCAFLFQERGCGAVSIWDDDDWKYPGFLSDVSELFELDKSGKHYLTGCKWSYLINARNLWGENQKAKGASSWGYAGCTLSFRRIAWEKHKISDYEYANLFVGYDPAFVRSFHEDHHGPVVSENPYNVLSFCHMQNVYHFCRGGGEDMRPWINANLSQRAVGEIELTSNYMFANNLHPPQKSGPY